MPLQGTNIKWHPYKAYPTEEFTPPSNAIAANIIKALIDKGNMEGARSVSQATQNYNPFADIATGGAAVIGPLIPKWKSGLMESLQKKLPEKGAISENVMKRAIQGVPSEEVYWTKPELSEGLTKRLALKDIESRRPKFNIKKYGKEVYKYNIDTATPNDLYRTFGRQIQSIGGGIYKFTDALDKDITHIGTPKQIIKRLELPQYNSQTNEVSIPKGFGDYLKYSDSRLWTSGITKRREISISSPNAPAYSGQHFKEPNQLFWLRTGEGFTKEGKSTYHIDEIQSDRFSRMRKYSEELEPAPLSEQYYRSGIKKAIADAVSMRKDYVTFTTGKEQLKRSLGHESAKGLVQLYDEKIKNTADKYLKQWHVTVKPMELDSGVGVWGFPITPKMKDDVLTKGQKYID